MKFWIVRRSSLGLGLVLASTLVVACEDKRVKELDTGIGRDSVLSILTSGGTKSATDTMPNIYKRSRYLMDGKEYEILYFTAKHFTPGKDTIPLKETTPVVLVDNKLVGRGWAFWDSVSTAHKMPPQKRD
jgi:hypothetical protein